MESADAAAFAAAMQEGVSAAYKAVMKPAEGTVLTVSRLAAKRAVEVAAEEKDVETVLEEAIREGRETLAQTTEMNPVLKKAGVVDAGGKGYLLILEGHAGRAAGRTHAPAGRGQRPGKGEGGFPGHECGGHHLRFRHRVHRPQGPPQHLWSRCAPTSTASVTAW